VGFSVPTYQPAGPGSGIAYLGHTPRTYFDDAEVFVEIKTSRFLRTLDFPLPEGLVR